MVVTSDGALCCARLRSRFMPQAQHCASSPRDFANLFPQVEKSQLCVLRNIVLIRCYHASGARKVGRSVGRSVGRASLLLVCPSASTFAVSVPFVCLATPPSAVRRCVRSFVRSLLRLELWSLEWPQLSSGKSFHHATVTLRDAICILPLLSHSVHCPQFSAALQISSENYTVLKMGY